jgi:hypothetical protein
MLVCEIIFNICKCTTQECRLFVASQLPVLLWMEWCLDKEDAALEEDISAMEIALLAAFQQDLNIETAQPIIRVPDIKQPSIYHKPPPNLSEEERQRFPWNRGEAKDIRPHPSLYPTRPITKIDEYSRNIVFFRLCRFLQDNLPSLPAITKVSYCILIERLATVGTKMENKESFDSLSKLANKFPPVLCQDNPSMMSLLDYQLQAASLDDTSPPMSPASDIVPVEQLNIEWLRCMFEVTSAGMTRRFPASSPIFLLWADALTALGFQFHHLVVIVRKQLLRRSRSELLPLPSLALA